VSERVRLDDIIDVASGQVDPRVAPYCDLPHVGGDNIESGSGRLSGLRTARELSLISGKYEFGPSDVLYSKIRPALNKVALPDFVGICSADIYPLRPRANRLERRYLAHLLRHDEFLAYAEKHSTRTNIPKINREALLAYELTLPPVGEQRRIADILDKADAIRRKRKEAITLSEELLRSAFLEMFGDPLANPKGWKLKPLGEVADVNRGKFSPRPRNDPRFYGGAFPFIQTGDLRNSTGYLRIWKQTLNEQGCEVSRRFARGTVAIAIAANIGDTAIIDFDFYCPDSVVGIGARSSLATSEYLERMLRFFQPKLLAEAPETAQKNINLETLRPLLVPAPPNSVQERFSSVYRAAYGAAAQMQDAVHETEILFQSLVQRAFSEKPSGELTC